MFTHRYLASELPVTDSTTSWPAAPGTPLRDLARSPGGADRAQRRVTRSLNRSRPGLLPP
jgi:hypothetical protein